MNAPLPADEYLDVMAFLRDGDVIGVPSGNMAALYRVHNDDVEGEAEFEYLGVFAITGKFNTVRRVKP